MTGSFDNPGFVTDIEPPKIYRPVLSEGPITTVSMLMAELAKEGIIRKKLRYYRLETLLVRETRFVSQLGRLAVDRYAEALQALAPQSAGQEVTIPVIGLTTVIKGKSKQRVVLKIEHPDEIIEERRRALFITRQMTGLDIPSFSNKLDITIGRVLPGVDTVELRARLQEVVPTEITLLPIVIESAIAE